MTEAITPAPGPDVSLRKYLWQFTLAQITLGLANLAIQSALDVDLGAGANVGVLAAAVAVAMHAFVKDHGRALNQSERWTFTLWGFATSIAWSVIALAGAAIFLHGFSGADLIISQAVAFVRQHPEVSALVVFVISILILGLIYVFSGIFSRKFEKQMAAKAEAKPPVA